MTMTPHYHLDPATLMSFAAGTLAEPLAAATAAHLSMCSACRDELQDMELIGSSLLGALPASGPGFQAVAFATLPRDGARSSMIELPECDDDERLPLPIARRYGLSYDAIPWRRLAPGVWHHRLSLASDGEGDLRLLKIAAGWRMPEHGHGGAELTIVLDGAYSDASGEYRRGDIQDLDDETEHQPIADSRLGCICLIASERPARFKGLVGRLMQTWTGM